MGPKNNNSVRVREQLLSAIGQIHRAGAVCVSGDQPLVRSGLEVEDLEAIGLP